MLVRFTIKDEGTKTVHSALQKFTGAAAGDINSANEEPSSNLLNLLDQSVKQLKKDVQDLSVAQLKKLLAAEQGGKTRKGVVEAIERAIGVVESGVEQDSGEDGDWVDIPFIGTDRQLLRQRNQWDTALRSDHPPSLSEVQRARYRVVA